MKIKQYFNKKLLLASVLVLAGLLILTPVITYAYFYFDLSDKNRILNRNASGLLLQDREGEPFFSFYQARSETYTTLDQIPEHTQQALIATEDKDFYDHPGFSLRGIARAFLVNLKAGEVVQGGSTITQELIKNALLTSDRTLLRKYQEITLSLMISQKYSKEDILEMYLNSVYFGAGAFGIEDAAQTYFGIPASELSIGQSALLIGLLPAPSALSPFDNDPELAKAKQKVVLQEMVEEGYLSSLKAQEIIAEPLNYQAKTTGLNTLAPHFAIYVRDQLIDKYGEERVIRSGFTVKTTLNKEYQELAQTTVANEMVRLRHNNATNGAVVAIDPKTGQILAMVGSYDWDDEEFGKVNMAITPRQPGSSFKPIIYAAALEEKEITPATLLEDKPKEYPGGYKPMNYDRSFRGSVTVRRALANSLNIPAVEVLDTLGVSRGLAIAKNMGITTLQEDASFYGLSLVLGSGEVPLVELTGAYAVFANNGYKETVTPILEIRDKYGRLVDQYESNPKSILSEETAYLISSILSDNRARAEVFGSLLTINRTAAVKTGTTSDYKDALTVGYTPSLVIGVWVGNNDNTAMNSVAGSMGAAPIWRRLMEGFLQGTPNELFQAPSNITKITVCPFAQFSEAMATSSGYPEYFISGTEPRIPCPSARPVPTPTAGPENTPEPQPTPTSVPTTPEPTTIPTISPIKNQPDEPISTSGPEPTPLIEINPGELLNNN